MMRYARVVCRRHRLAEVASHYLAAFSALEGRKRAECGVVQSIGEDPHERVSLASLRRRRQALQRKRFQYDGRTLWRSPGRGGPIFHGPGADEPLAASR